MNKESEALRSEATRRISEVRKLLHSNNSETQAKSYTVLDDFKIWLDKNNVTYEISGLTPDEWKKLCHDTLLAFFTWFHGVFGRFSGPIVLGIRDKVDEGAITWKELKPFGLDPDTLYSLEREEVIDELIRRIKRAKNFSSGHVGPEVEAEMKRQVSFYKLTARDLLISEDEFKNFFGD